jgi:murein DD-endopeptidase MepM/ murein hydrolase activator NlpD
LVVATFVAASAMTSGAETTTTVAPSSTAETTSTTVAEAPTTSAASPTTLSAADRSKRAEAAGNLNAARAADSEIAAGLQAINESAQETQSKIDAATSRLDAARQTLEITSAELTSSDEKQSDIESKLLAQAVEGFKTGGDEVGFFFTDRSMNRALRQTQLLEQANTSTADLLEQLRALLEDRQIAQAEAEQAESDAAALERELQAELDNFREQESVQLRLRAEAQSRIARWESELSAYAAEDREIQRVIARGSGSSPAPATPLPRQPSALGYQWPVVGPVTSPYGYRIHPVYGTRKLHSGVDVGAPRGTPIAATTDGVVIFSGRRGGYGNTVIVDHGGGLSSLYAHMSQISAGEGATVNRGDVVGLVGATGTATGNHLHFEIRHNGSATNPAPFLP